LAGLPFFVVGHGHDVGKLCGHGTLDKGLVAGLVGMGGTPIPWQRPTLKK